MPRLVVLSEGLTGRSCELTAERTTIGRVEDNAFPIAEPSISSHHCEVLLRGNEVVIRDLDSTNGTFIDGQAITESALRPGQLLRLGQIELRLEAGAATAPAPAPAPAKKPVDQTLVLPRGVSLNDLEQGSRPGGFDATTSKGFSKKDNKGSQIFIIAGVVLVVVIIVLLVIIYFSITRT